MTAPATAALAVLASLLLGSPAPALESEAAVSPRARVTLVSEAASIEPGKPFRVAMHQRLTRGWHTYWLNAGDAGEPPTADFVLPAGAHAEALQFPAPKRIPYGPLVNFGYEGEATFTVRITPPADLAPGSVFPVEMKGRWLVCEQICIPEEGTFRLEIPVEALARPALERRALFARAEAAQPRAGVLMAAARFEGGSGTLDITGPELSAGAVREAFFFPADGLALDHAAPQTLSPRDGGFSLSLTRPSGSAAAAPPPATLDGVVAIVDGAGVRSAYTVSAAVTAVASVAAPSIIRPAQTPAPPRSVLPLWQAMLWAAVGGLILNLMPCVFPILAIKAIGIAGLGRAERGTVRAHALSYTAGVVVSFVALAALLVGVRAAGGAVGWGFQFTSPLFVAAMAWLMLLIGLNLSGVYHVNLTVTAGSDAASKGGHGGSFATGALAVAVATPCTAPFMAAAIGAALAMPPQNTLLVFAAMGLGMAAPYGLLAAFPQLARLMPRPGLWMERLKQALAFPMYGAAAWLAWVLAQQAGADGILAVLAGGVLIGLAAWAYGISQQGGGRGVWIARGAAAAALLGALALLPNLGSRPLEAVAGENANAWSREKVAALQAQGRPVFVNLTAAWCISCKVNERVALKRDSVQQAFAAQGIAYLTGDWTNGDPRISALLREHGREGVPLYLFYPEGATQPVILPEILTESIVLDTIGGAAG